MAKNLVRGFLQRFSVLMVAGEMQHSVCVAPVTFISIFYYSSQLFIYSLGFFHFFSSVSAITSICYLLLPVLSLLLTHFSFLPSLSWVSLRGGTAVREVFPTSLSSHFSSAPLQHPMHTHASASIYPCSPPPPALSVRGTNAFVQYLQQTD